jgi:hypothetical protein
MKRSPFSAVVILLLAASASRGAPKPCISIDAAGQKFNKDLCISAHIYDVVQLEDGTRFLDVCSPQTPDDQCRFTVVSPWEDRNTVGDLAGYRDKDVAIRGTVQAMNGRSGMVLSHSRQFSGGPPRFRPNPLLARGFGGDESRPPVSDPNLRSQGGHRAFINSRDKIALPAK